MWGGLVNLRGALFGERMRCAQDRLMNASLDPSDDPATTPPIAVYNGAGFTLHERPRDEPAGDYWLKVMEVVYRATNFLAACPFWANCSELEGSPPCQPTLWPREAQEVLNQRLYKKRFNVVQACPLVPPVDVVAGDKVYAPQNSPVPSVNSPMSTSVSLGSRAGSPMVLGTPLQSPMLAPVQSAPAGGRTSMTSVRSLSTRASAEGASPQNPVHDGETVEEARQRLLDTMGAAEASVAQAFNGVSHALGSGLPSDELIERERDVFASMIAHWRGTATVNRMIGSDVGEVRPSHYLGAIPLTPQESGTGSSRAGSSRAGSSRSPLLRTEQAQPSSTPRWATPMAEVAEEDEQATPTKTLSKQFGQLFKGKGKER